METRYQRIGREQAERKAAREAATKKRQRKPRKRLWSEEYKRTADRIDGYDRDDLGYSPDY